MYTRVLSEVLTHEMRYAEFISVTDRIMYVQQWRALTAHESGQHENTLKRHGSLARPEYGVCNVFSTQWGTDSLSYRQSCK